MEEVIRVTKSLKISLQRLKIDMDAKSMSDVVQQYIDFVDLETIKAAKEAEKDKK